MDIIYTKFLKAFSGTVQGFKIFLLLNWGGGGGGGGGDISIFEMSHWTFSREYLKILTN